MGKQSRPYRSELREAQAAQTRAKVLDAAAEQFAAHGYAGTTLAAIASGAGVSVETVKLQGAKHELLLAAWGRRLAGGVEPFETPLLAAEDRRAPFLALSDHELVPELARNAARLSAEGLGLWRAFAAGAQHDAEVGAAFAASLKIRRQEFRLFVDVFDERGLIANDRPRDELAATLAFLVSAEGYQQLVLESGFTDDAYCDWLVAAIQRLVLAA